MRQTAVICTVLFLCWPINAASLRVVHSSPDQLTIEWKLNPSDVQLSTTSIPSGFPGQTGTGAIQGFVVPVKTFLVGIPPSALPAVSVEELNVVVRDSPLPTTPQVDDTSQSQISGWISGPVCSRIRGLRIGTYRIAPILPLDGGHRRKILCAARINFRFPGSPGPTAKPSPDPFFASLKRVLLNYDAAIGWRSVSIAPAKKQVSSSLFDQPEIRFAVGDGHKNFCEGTTTGWNI